MTDPLTIAAVGSGVAGLWGAHNQNQAQNKNFDAQQAAAQQAAARQAQVAAGVNGQMQSGQNPFAQMIMQMFQGGQKAPTNGLLPQMSLMQGGAQQPAMNMTPQGMSPGTNQWWNPAASGGKGGWAWDGTGANMEVGDYLKAINDPTNPMSSAFNGTAPMPPAAAQAFGDVSLEGGSNSPPGTGGTTPTGGPSLALGGDPSTGMPAFTPPAGVDAGQYQAFMAMLPASVQAQMMQAGSFNAPQIDLSQFASGSSGFNSGQDALLQMLRAGPGYQKQSGVDAALGGQLGGQSYDTTDLFKSLDQQSQTNLNDQLAQLNGSFGSFGARLGTSAMAKQGKLRTDAVTNLNAQKQAIGAQSFNDAQARIMQALGIGTGRESSMSQNALGVFGTQGSAASSLGNLGLGQTGQLSNLAQSNQQAGLSGLQSNLQAFMQAQSGNQNAALQAALANQAQAGQFNLANAGASNAASQFNIGNNLNAQQFNSQMGQGWNQFMLQGLGQAAGLQSSQQAQNIQLLQILAGLQPGQVPQYQPSAMPGAVGDMSQLLMMMQLLGGGKKQGSTALLPGLGQGTGSFFG